MIWVVVSPWLPRSLGLRVLAAIPLAIGLGAFGVIEGSNPDFLVLGYEPIVVVVLLGLVGLVGASMAVVDAWLDRRLPQPSVVDRRGERGLHRHLARRGASSPSASWPPSSTTALRPVGIALLVSGVATLGWWYLRYRGAERPPLMLRLLGSGGVIAAVVLGFVARMARTIRLALGDLLTHAQPTTTRDLLARGAARSRA